MVIYVVKNASRPVSGEDSPVPDGKRFVFQGVCIVTLRRLLCKRFLRGWQLSSCSAIDKEYYFDMGGCEYLESRIDATEYGELLPTVDDAVCGLISILDAMNTGDNDRFHLETLHHSKQEIRRILERGGKIDRTAEYAVDDEDEEYEQYHGFSMQM